MATDTEIHFRELLLTLDYLLRYTDEDHPATQIDICKHALDFGLRYEGGKAGDDVKRQRIGACLSYLRKVSDEYTDDVPFVLETTDSGKYYIEQRHGLNEGQVAKLLAAVKNDKYTKDEDTDFLIERILSAFSTSEQNRDLIKKEYKSLIRGTRKFDKETAKKIALVEKAYRENKMIKLVFSVLDPKKNVMVDYFIWYRVVFIKEINSHLNAFLLPIFQSNMDDTIGRLVLFNNYIFEEVSKLNIVKDVEKNILCEDFESKRDFNKLFAETNPKLMKKYGSLDNFIEETKLPKGGKVCIVSFYFKLVFLDFIKKSYEEFFSEDFHYQETTMIEGIEKEVEDILPDLDNWTIVEGSDNKKKPTHGLVNISVDNDSFLSWLLSDVHGDGFTSIADMITLIKPASTLERLASYYSSHLLSRVKYLKKNKAEELYKTLYREHISDIEEEQRNNQEIYIENSMTAQLDNGLMYHQNVYIKGLEGSGKTSIARSWLYHNKDKINGVFLDGLLLKDPKGDKHDIKDLHPSGQLFSSYMIDGMLTKDDTVVIVDDYHLLSTNQKYHILLLCDGYVIDERVEGGIRKLDGIIFVAVINTVK